MQIDIFSKIMYVRAKDEKEYFKFNIIPSSEMDSRMAIGTLVIEKEEAKRAYDFLHAYFEGREFPNYVVVKDFSETPRHKIPMEDRPPVPVVTHEEILSEAEKLQQINFEDEPHLAARKPVKVEEMTLGEKAEMG